MKNRNLLGNLEDETPVVLVENGYKKQGRGVFILLLMALLMPLVGWGQHPFTLTTASDTINGTETLYWIESNGADGFYMIPDPNNTNASTTNAPNEKMLWFFMDAGIDGGKQYYYVINYSTRLYLKLIGTLGGHNSIGVGADEGDLCKFFVVASGTKWALRPKSGVTGYTVNKRGSSVSYGGDYYLKSSTAGITDVNSMWDFIAENDVQWAHPFTNSTSSDMHYYLIQNRHSSYTSFYMSTDASSYVTVSNVEDDNRKWYFVEASADATIPNMKYYYIVNAVTGNYMYFNSTNYSGSALSNVFKIQDHSGGVEDNYQFAIVNAIGKTYSAYAIMPKNLIGLYNDKYTSLGSATMSNNERMDTRKDRGSDNNIAHWVFVETVYPSSCSTPTITYSSETGKITITATPADAVIHYTTDGVTVPSSTVGTVYNTPFDVSDPVTIMAIATKTGCTDSEVAIVSFPQVAEPTVQNNGSNAISITTTTEGATIYYTTDGTTPTTASTLYTGPLTENVSGVLIKAIAVKEGCINSTVGSGSVTLKCAKPVITRSGDYVTISCAFPASGVTIYYTKNGGDPTTSSSVYSSPIPVIIGDVIKAIAAATGYDNSDVATKTILNELEPDPEGKYHITNQTDFEIFVDMANTTDGASYHYVLDANVTAVSEITVPFTGIFDGNYHTITGLSDPLFNTVNDGTVKNVVLKEVAINSSANAVGAIAGTAKGYSRIYNCGILPNSADFPAGTHPTVTTTGSCAGGIVGNLEDDSRVVNCFSYADVSSSGYAAGIVGNNTFASTAEVENVSGTDKYTHLRTMVVNCMFYGDIAAGSNVWPVYGGEKIINGGGSGADISDGYDAINNYNFYSDSCSFPVGKEPSTTHIYNCSWPAKYEYLTRYEFHRYLLNSNRELCGWWVGAPQAPSTMSTTDVQAVPKDATLMAKWVLDRSVAPFPILKPFGYYPSPINIDADASWRESANEWEGKKMGKVSVTVNPGDHAPSGITATTTPLEITITDMDTLRSDFCYRKIQLPYYNSVFGNPNGTTWEAKYGGNYGEYAVTGWEITKVNGSSTGTGDFVADWQDGYNFADRNSTKKDLYGVSGRIFAQGGYYYVPNDVTTIEITAHWGKAVYLGNGDNYYDRVDLDYLVEKAGGSSTNGTTIRENRPGTAFEPAGTRPSTLGNGQPVRTGNIKEVATSYISNSGTVFDNALVLVGNHQYCTGDWHVNPSRSFTIMSVDFDLDNEPDYCLEWQLGKGVSRFEICPIRFDFLPVVEIGLGLKKDGSTQYYSLGCYHPKGHFEVTETALIRFGQFEFSNRRTTECPLILNGGIFDQYVRGTTGAENNKPDKITYIILGGNLKMLSFTPGAHVNSSYTYSTRHCAVNVIGGRFESLYLSGNFNESVTPYADNPHCYIDGGWFSHVAAAGKEGINGDVTFKINHSIIHEFYGGGVMMGHEVTGSIDVTIDNSLVNKYCGGPKFGDMTSGTTVTTSATGTTFGVYYGAGNGGTNYVQYDRTDGTYYNNNGFNWTGTGSGAGHIDNYSPGAYRNAATGYQANYDMELINVSTGTFYDCAVNRTYFYAAQYAATNTGTVSNTLDSCIVLGNFYGAGNLGGVNGNVTSKLTDTEVRGSAFGGGYSASIPKVQIYKKDKQVPVIDLYTGSITPQKEGTYDEYTWTNDPSLNTGNPSGMINGKPYFYTEISLDSLGTVHGNVSLTIEGNSTIGSYVNGVLKPDSGNVFGGGHESLVTGNTEVKIFGKTKVYGNIYGGGNMGLVGRNTKVIINGKYTETGTGTNGGGN